MTLAVAWLRSFRDTEELCLASDSRLRFGCAWDCCPKIIALPRGDSAMCFAGHTYYAYPSMLQVYNAIASHAGLSSRAIDLTDLRGHVLRLINGMRDAIHDPPKGGQTPPDDPEVVFILAGYSWKTRSFRIWTLQFDPVGRRFQFRTATNHEKQTKGTKLFVFEGNRVPEATDRLYTLLKSKGKLTTGGFDMEPFEVVRDMIRNDSDPAIGGPPQFLKIYRFMSTRPYMVYWPNRKSKKMTLLGRPLLHYELPSPLAIDPDSLEVVDPRTGKILDLAEE